MTWNSRDITEIKKGDRVRAVGPNGHTREGTVTSAPIGSPAWITVDERWDYSAISRFEVWAEDEIDLSKIRKGDTVTVEVKGPRDAGVYKITGQVFVSAISLRRSVGPVFLDVENVTVLDHTPNDPEWWSWPLISYDGHVFALDTVSSSRSYHRHGWAYCGCNNHTGITRNLQHHDSTRDLRGVRKAAITIEDGDFTR